MNGALHYIRKRIEFAETAWRWRSSDRWIKEETPGKPKGTQQVSVQQCKDTEHLASRKRWILHKQMKKATQHKCKHHIRTSWKAQASAITIVNITPTAQQAERDSHWAVTCVTRCKMSKHAFELCRLETQTHVNICEGAACVKREWANTSRLRRRALLVRCPPKVWIITREFSLAESIKFRESVAANFGLSLDSFTRYINCTG